MSRPSLRTNWTRLVACTGAVADALLEAGADGTPRVAKALDDACVASQAQMPTEMPFAQSGSTGVVSWIHGGEDDTSVFASCLGDSKAQVPTQLSETLLRTLALALALALARSLSLSLSLFLSFSFSLSL